MVNDIELVCLDRQVFRLKNYLLSMLLVCGSTCTLASKKSHYCQLNTELSYELQADPFIASTPVARGDTCNSSTCFTREEVSLIKETLVICYPLCRKLHLGLLLDDSLKLKVTIEPP